MGIPTLPLRPARRLAAATFLVVAAAAPLAGCGDDGSSSRTTAASPTSAAPGSESGDDASVITEPGPIALTVGQSATIEMEGNVTTGYSWSISTAPDAGVAGVVSDEYIAPDGGRPGAGGHQKVVIEGVAPGSTSLVMSYARPWETDQPPARTAEFTVTVR